MADYPLDYVKYDYLGMLELRCMVCGTTVGARTYESMPDRADPTKTVNVIAFKQLSNHRQVPVVLENEDGLESLIEPIVCVNCEHVELDIDKLLPQIEEGWKIQMRSAGRAEDTIKETVDKVGLSKMKKKAKKDKGD